jgi:hypothetical protein
VSPQTFPQFPASGASLSPDALMGLIASFRSWSAGTGAALLDLDHEVGGLSAQTKDDHTLAFVIWQSLDRAIAEVADGTSTYPDIRFAPLRIPLLANDRSTLAANATEAAQLIQALIDSMRAQLDTNSTVSAATAGILSDLATAGPLAKDLAMGAGELASLRSELSNLRAAPDPTAVGSLATRARELVEQLRQSEAERSSLLAARAGDASRLDALRSLETEARQVAAESAAKILAPPRFGIPSVAALGAAPDPATMLNRPWPAQRSLLAEWATKLDRAQAAFAHIISAHTNALAERNELRQFADAIRHKAMSLGFGEAVEVAAAYAEVRSLLWTAPTDMTAARSAVANYQAVVESTRITQANQAAASAPHRSDR